MLFLDDDFETAFAGPADLFEAEYDFKRPTKNNADNNKQLIILVASGRGDDSREDMVARWLYGCRSYVFGPSGLKGYGSATLRFKI